MIEYNVLIVLQTSLTIDSLQTDINPMHELIEQSDQLKLGWIAAESSNIKQIRILMVMMIRFII